MEANRRSGCAVGLSLVALEIDAQDPPRLATFWARMLERTPDPSGSRLPGRLDTDFELRFVPTPASKAGPHRMHLDLTSTSAQDQQRSVDLALSLGGSHLDVGQREEEGHVVLADPEDNEFCVIEADNRFLADTSRIGALAGEGMPAVGYFWAHALGWPLVWDQDEETAIQHPRGGTKITWGGPPVRSKTARSRMRWVLATGSRLDLQIDRLRALGAKVCSAETDRVELADPEGNEFILTTTATADPGLTSR